MLIERVSRARVFKRSKGICGICGEKVPKHKWSIDHIVPLSRGGKHEYANVQVAHKECNRMKADHLPWEFVPIAYRSKGGKPRYRNRTRAHKR